MPHTLVDTNVFVDILGEDPTWAAWSSRSLRDAADAGHLLVNQVIYAELASGFAGIAELDTALDAMDCVRAAMPWSAAFLAGRAFLDYRRRGGTKTAPLPDFFIGAHAAVAKYRLLTRDAARYRAYFPTVELIAP